MSIGGTVIETIDVPATATKPARVWINTKEDSPGGSTCAIYVEASAAARCVQPEDAVWWQGDKAFWSPRSRAFRDYPLKRSGTSGVKRPKVPISTFTPLIDLPRSLPSGQGA